MRRAVSAALMVDVIQLLDCAEEEMITTMATSNVKMRRR